MGARGLWVAILGPDGEFRAARPVGETGDQGGRGADQQVGLASQCTRPCNHGLEFTQSGLQAVHFPVAGDQRPDGVGHVKYPADVSVIDALAEPRRQFQTGSGNSIPLAVNRFKSPTRPRLRGGRCHFMMRFQLGDALLRKSILNGSELSPGTTRFPSPAKTSWTHASRNSESLIKLARQDCHGHRDGRFDCQFRGLGHCRHLQGVRPVVARQDRQDRDFDRAVPPDLYREAAAARPQLWPSAHVRTGPRLRARPPGAAADHSGSRTG